MGVIPNFQTVNDPNQIVTPLSVKQKFELFLRETVDPFTILSGAAGAALSQSDNDNPKYGQGSGPYAERSARLWRTLLRQNFSAMQCSPPSFMKILVTFAEAPNIDSGIGSAIH